MFVNAVSKAPQQSRKEAEAFLCSGIAAARGVGLFSEAPITASPQQRLQKWTTAFLKK